MPKILASTQGFIDIIDLKDDVVILNGGRFRIVLETTSVNFDLLSEKEQDAAIFSYAGLVNSLDFPIQVVIKTRQTDISKYLDYLSNHEKSEPSQALKEQLQDYLEFVKQLVVENTILSKKFYCIVPYWSLETQKKDFFSPFLDLLSLNKRSKTAISPYSQAAFEDAKKIFERRQEELSWQFRRLGIKIRRLATAELISFFYQSLNPEAQNTDSVKNDAPGFQTAFTKPATI
ncbi:MAG: hypothetical protein UT63_C0082G0006 [Candidatus Gottesmanbacteria bacterium GW2011_GWC2_39_8]|uniref:Uncharacterized protein n=1 Tax=Candidatus Gottesmanbacteria bacterium GW2011_GWC2_39_8 TaxID=1618450 RepID=A0A0G0Q1C4_9BACT|nr:MAG: hypothetical protein UT63_C0082G0006 [Candidatus Gottesmanbacteria bacterium GW2011_GWC2_39_8]